MITKTVVSDLCELTGRPKNKLMQLALDLPKVPKGKLKFPMLFSEKVDGVFCLALKLNGKVTIYSRTGEIYTSMRHIEEELEIMLNNAAIVIFEAFIPGTVQAVISGAARDTKGQHTELKAWCHDLLLLDNFLGTEQSPEYFCRTVALDILVSNRYSYLLYAPQTSVNSLEEALRLAEEIWDRGGEGGVLRNPDAPYSPGKRNADIIKVKRGVSYDLQVTGVYEGKGKYAGTLGGIEVRWKNGETLKLSGMTDAQRIWWWTEPEMIVGKIVQVDAMAESSKGKLREPRFKGIRHDKTEGDF